MERINPSTKKAENLRSSARYNKGRELSDVYSSYSSRKMAAYRRCLKLYSETDGNNFHIAASNFTIFTVAWDGKYNDELGVFYITPSHDYFIPD